MKIGDQVKFTDEYISVLNYRGRQRVFDKIYTILSIYEFDPMDSEFAKKCGTKLLTIKNKRQTLTRILPEWVEVVKQEDKGDHTLDESNSATRELEAHMTKDEWDKYVQEKLDKDTNKGNTE